MAISFAEAQLGNPYLWGGTGPDAYDCSGLVMMAYRAAGVFIPRTADQQFLWGPQVPASQVEPGDLVFFAGADGAAAAPGHVGLVIARSASPAPGSTPASRSPPASGLEHGHSECRARRGFLACRGPERCRESSSGSCSSGFVALATTSVAMSMTFRPRFRAAALSCSKA